MPPVSRDSTLKWLRQLSSITNLGGNGRNLPNILHLCRGMEATHLAMATNPRTPFNLPGRRKRTWLTWKLLMPTNTPKACLTSHRERELVSHTISLIEWLPLTERLGLQKSDLHLTQREWVSKRRICISQRKRVGLQKSVLYLTQSESPKEFF